VKLLYLYVIFFTSLSRAFH